jgi:hypothetical protein
VNGGVSCRDNCGGKDFPQTPTRRYTKDVMAARRHKRGRGGINLASPPRVEAPLQGVRGLLRGDWLNASRSDLRLLRRAIREGWDVPGENRRPILDVVLAQLGKKDWRRNLTICQIAIEADMADDRAEEAARLAAALLPPATPLGEAERAAIRAVVEAKIRMRNAEGPPPPPQEQQPAAPEPAMVEPAPATPAAAPQVPTLTARGAASEATPLQNPFWRVEPFCCGPGW